MAGLTFNNGRNAAAMTSTSSLSVGINCTPNSQFEVLGSTGGALTDGIRVSRNTLQSSQYGVINYTSGILNLTGVNTSGGGEIRLNTSDGTTTNERMRITSTGVVGIGTSSPTVLGTGYATLDVRGSSGGGINMGNGTYSGYIYCDTEFRLQSSNSAITFLPSGSEKMRITSAGNLGIGTSSPSQPLHVYATSTTTSSYFETSSANSYIGLKSTSGVCYIGNVGYALTFEAGGSERMRITNNSYGTLLAVGTSTPTNGGSAASWITINGSTAGSYSGGLAFAYNSAAKVYQFWDNNNFYIQNGALGVYLARDAASWSSVSDERLKDVTGNINNAVSSLLTLSTIKHTYKSDNNKIEHLGLIAQEIQEVFPQVVDKYTIKDDETKTEYLSVRYTELVPVLVAAIKELEARLKILENK